MKKEAWLRKEIDSWRSDGLIDDVAANAILSRYPESTTKLGIAVILAGSFGAILIGLGIIAVFASNWSGFTNLERALIASTPIILCGAACIFACMRKWKTMAFWEPAGILWFISAIAGTCLVAQTYNLGGSVPDLVLLLAVMTWPIPLTTGSSGAMSLWLALPFVWLGCRLDIMGFNENKLHALGTTLLLLLASAPAYVAFIRRKFPPFALYIGSLTTALAYSAGVAASILLCAEDLQFEDSSVFVFWGCSAVLTGIAAAFKLPHWPTIALNVAIFCALFTPIRGFSIFPAYVSALLLAVGTIARGIAKSRLALLNKGSLLLFWLILFKFFASRMDFALKGLILILCGALLAAMNIWLVRARRKGASK